MISGGGQWQDGGAKQYKGLLILGVPYCLVGDRSFLRDHFFIDMGNRFDCGYGTSKTLPRGPCGVYSIAPTAGGGGGGRVTGFTGWVGWMHPSLWLMLRC